MQIYQEGYMKKHGDNLKRVWRSTKGATAVEYALIAALIAIVCMGSLKSLGTEIKTKFESMINILKDVDTQEILNSSDTNT